MDSSGIKSTETPTRILKESEDSIHYSGKQTLDSDCKIKQLSTDKTYIITELKLYSQGLGTLSCSNPFKLAEKSCISSYCSVDLKSHNSVTLKTLIETPHQRLEGKFFLCRTISYSVNLNSLMTVVEIPDFDMKDRGAILSLHNYLHPEDEEEQTSAIFSPGTIVVVKNPMFSKTSTDPLYVVRCDNPTDVVLLDDNEFIELFPGLEWPSGQRNEEDFLVLKTPCHTGWKTAKDWKSIAALRLGKKNYVGAIKAYTLALDVNPRDMEVLTQRCALYLRLKMHTKSLKDSELILKENPIHGEAICYKATSLIALSYYSVAIEFLEHHIMDSTTIIDPVMECKYLDVLLKAKEYYNQQQHGIYDLMKMLPCPFKFFHDCADYIGSITQCEINGKGRGIIATKDIKCGELIIGAKAFEIAFADFVGQEHMWTLDSETGRYISPANAKLNASIAHRLHRDSQLCKIFYDLHYGFERSESADAVENRYVDMRRIDSIVRHNNFIAISETGGGSENIVTSCGIWLSASFFNHSCSDSNVRSKIFGNFLFIRASKNISTGEELTLPYVPCTIPYPERLREFSKSGFICECRLCLLDAKDPEDTHIRRSEILTELAYLQKEISPRLDKIEALIQELQDQRVEDPMLNVYIALPMMKLANIYMKKNDYKLAAKILWSVNCSGCITIMNDVSLHCCIDCTMCYIQCNNLVKAKECAAALRSHLVREYGICSTDVLNYVSEGVAEVIVENGILL